MTVKILGLRTVKPEDAFREVVPITSKIIAKIK